MLYMYLHLYKWFSSYYFMSPFSSEQHLFMLIAMASVSPLLGHQRFVLVTITKFDSEALKGWCDHRFCC